MQLVDFWYFYFNLHLSLHIWLPAGNMRILVDIVNLECEQFKSRESLGIRNRRRVDKVNDLIVSLSTLPQSSILNQWKDCQRSRTNINITRIEHRKTLFPGPNKPMTDLTCPTYNSEFQICHSVTGFNWTMLNGGIFKLERIKLCWNNTDE